MYSKHWCTVVYNLHVILHHGMCSHCVAASIVGCCGRPLLHAPIVAAARIALLRRASAVAAARIALLRCRDAGRLS